MPGNTFGQIFCLTNGASRTARRWAAWWMAARLACRSARRMCSAISTGGESGRAASPPRARRPTPCRFFRVCSRDERPARRSAWSCSTPTPAHRITITSKTCTVPAMPISHGTPNTASAIIAAAGALVRARRSGAWRRARSPKSCWRNLACRSSRGRNRWAIWSLR